MLIRFYKLKSSTLLLRRCYSDSRPVRVRFAPSPTGSLHLGGFRTALYNYLFAKANSGRFVLRIEDTDRTRLVPGAADSLEEILGWLGIPPDESPLAGGQHGPYRQSERLGLYTDHINVLLRTGAAYRCFCSEKRLELMRREAAKAREPSRYDGKCAGLSQAEVDRRLALGEPHTVRFRLSPFVEKFNDLVYGPTSHDVSELEGDPVVVKSDGYPTYHFANVVDDHLMEVSHVLRGAEWQISTPKHILLYRAFGWEPPVFAHLPLIMNSDGTKLSKRQGDLHIETLRSQGYLPESILNFVTLVGGGFNEKEYSLERLYGLEELCDIFSVDKIHTSSCKIEMSRLADLNTLAIGERLRCPRRKASLLADARRTLLAAGGDDADRSLTDEKIESCLLWAGSRVARLADLAHGDVGFVWRLPDNYDSYRGPLGRADVALVLARLRAVEKLSAEAVMEEARAYCQEAGVRQPDLMKLMRVVLSGRPVGPPVKEMVEALGADSVVSRMERYLSLCSDEREVSERKSKES